MNVIKPFDPWSSRLCTCPEKYSLNPYTGCAYRCIYCYASAYIPFFHKCRPKKNLLPRLEQDIRQLSPGSLVSLSNTSDPYPPLERTLNQTRKCLELFKACGIRVLIISKSDLVLRDIDLLSTMPAAVTMTITTLSFHEKLEPYAPSPHRRLLALKALGKAGVPIGLRLDPVFPYVTDVEIEEIIARAGDIGVTHIVSSTFKPRWDSWKKYREAFPQQADRVYNLYFNEGEKVGNGWYLPEGFRQELMSRVREACARRGISFASCREGFHHLHTSPSCDGSHLIVSYGNP